MWQESVKIIIYKHSIYNYYIMQHYKQKDLGLTYRGHASSSSQKHASSNILKISLPQNEIFQLKKSDIFHILLKMDCGYEAVLTSIHNVCLCAEIKKNMYTLWTLVLLYKNMGFKGVKLYRHVFVMYRFYDIHVNRGKLRVKWRSCRFYFFAIVILEFLRIPHLHVDRKPRHSLTDYKIKFGNLHHHCEFLRTTLIHEHR